MHEVRMPRLTHDMESAILLEWLKAEGDTVRPGEVLFIIETDKATADVEAEASGVLAGIAFQASQEVPVGARVAYLLAEGERMPGQVVAQSATGLEGRRGEKPAAASGLSAEKRIGSGSKYREDGRTLATPVASRMAREHALDLEKITGSGPHGRVILRDVEAWLAQSVQPSVILEEASSPAVQLQSESEIPEFEVIPLSSTQRTAGSRLLESVRQKPCFDLETECDMSNAIALRANATQRISFTAIVNVAVAQSLRQFPRLNAHFFEGQLRQFRDINLGVALAAEDGLLVPVIRQADRLNLSDMQAAIDELRSKASLGRFSLEQTYGATFTVTNLGMYDVTRFRAIINPPEVAILAVGGIQEKPLAQHGRVLVRPVMPLTLTVDHRALDGAAAAPFLMYLKKQIENP